MNPLSLDDAMFVFASRLASGGWQRLAAFEKVRALIQVDAGRQVGEQEAEGQDPEEALEGYRGWIHDQIDAALDDYRSVEIKGTHGE